MIIMTEIEIHGCMVRIDTLSVPRLQQLEDHLESNLRIVQKELDRRKTISISELALAMHEG